MPRMYHPAVGAEITVPDDAACIAVHEESGWQIAPEPVAANPAVMPEPVVYAPVVESPPEPEPEAKPKRAAKPKPDGEDTSTDS